MSRQAGEYKPPVVVDMFMWEKLAAPQEADSTAIRTCIGVATYDPTTCTGHMAHWVIPNRGDEADEVLAFAYSAAASCADIDDIQVWIRGGSGLDDPYAWDRRNYVIDSLVEIGIPKERMDIVWSRIGQTVLLHLGTETGQFSCQVVGQFDG